MNDSILSTLGFGSAGYGLQFLHGMTMTFATAVSSYLIALVLGCVLGIVGASRRVYFRAFWRLYRSIFAGIPTLLVLFFVYYAVPYIASQEFNRNLEIPPFAAGLCSLSLIYASYVGEVIRGAILNVPKGQVEACRALALGRIPTWLVVITPEVARLSLPGLTNNWVVLLKDTALVSVIGLADVVRIGQIAGSVTNHPLVFLSIAGGFYVVIVSCSLGALAKLRRRGPNGIAEISHD